MITLKTENLDTELLKKDLKAALIISGMVMVPSVLVYFFVLDGFGSEYPFVDLLISILIGILTMAALGGTIQQIQRSQKWFKIRYYEDKHKKRGENQS